MKTAVKQLPFFLAILLFLRIIFPQNIFAATVEFFNAPGAFDKEQEASIDIKISGAAANTSNYLRAAFYPDSTTSYFGYTFNHLNDWYNGISPIDPKKFLQIQIGGEGTWSGKMKIKPDISSPYFKGNGSYLLKIGRYTANGSSVSDWSSSVEVSITGMNPTSPPSQTPTSTNTPVPTKSPTLTTTKIPTTTKVPSITPDETTEASSSILGLSDSRKPEEKKRTESKVLGISESKFWFSFFGGGVIICVACGILLYQKSRREVKNEEI